MTDAMTLDSYLAAGGVLTNPTNVPPRYRAELMKLMATFVDSELAGAAGFADVINQGPGIKERIAAAKIVLEKTDHADRVLKIMGEFGADTDRYATHHPWTARLDRKADIGATRSEHDMRLAVFNYPISGWTDAVVMNLLMSRAVAEQLAEFSTVSYQPLAEAFRRIAPIEAHHGELALEGAVKLAENGESQDMQDAADYWWPRVAVSFGKDDPKRFEHLRSLGLRHSTNAALRERWTRAAEAALKRLGLKSPS
ncbi:MULTISPECIES: Phenylacetic acid catabolic protein [unclassified Ruegeria]|uniref:Phenylacetic acid catabolic protein n=1 Tax=unclassified Ruegeria TaxID=2625375 RepID=UPI001492851F|nr:MULTISPECIES: Phenylacetic acid catabolic protein [unclassified Ruegeria]NOD85616.1 phenylacetic acid catabolic [Ruegeria sp. HKCCD6119]